MIWVSRRLLLSLLFLFFLQCFQIHLSFRFLFPFSFRLSCYPIAQNCLKTGDLLQFKFSHLFKALCNQDNIQYLRKQPCSINYGKAVPKNTSFKKPLLMYLITIMIFFIPHFYFQYIYGLLTQEGICTNGIVTIGNETQILNQSAAEYIKNLSSDNRLMGEVFCQAMLNETITK